uniref:WDHD1/CFT4 second beta-propeller domain-containing protein n=1 Tax=Setaria viridis TaxID=4556 RepID=A0A4V6DE74_SETVI|nr:hypothetical protein SEVIR_2G150800v2 [Setaria viridis]
MHILSVSGPVVTAAGYGDQLAIVSHASDCLPSGDQVLDVMVFNISERAQSLSGHLLLTQSSQLSWFGFSDNGQLSSYDSRWMPLIRRAKRIPWATIPPRMRGQHIGAANVGVVPGTTSAGPPCWSCRWLRKIERK